MIRRAFLKRMAFVAIACGLFGDDLLKRSKPELMLSALQREIAVMAQKLSDAGYGGPYQLIIHPDTAKKIGLL